MSKGKAPLIFETLIRLQTPLGMGWCLDFYRISKNNNLVTEGYVLQKHSVAEQWIADHKEGKPR